MNPTDEQQAAIDLYVAGESFAVEAGAGTGKTTTLRAMAMAAPDRIAQYVAFNAGIVRDSAGKMPDHVRARTVHSLAWSVYRSDFGHRMPRDGSGAGGRQRPSDVARHLGVNPMVVPDAFGGRKRLAAGYLASHTLKALRYFCQSADREPGVQHFPYIEGLDLPRAGQRTFASNNEVARALLPALRRAWADIQSPSGQLRFNHEHYLKMWELEAPRINTEVVMFDEAQDASPVMLSIVEQQSHAQRVFVGDSQQSIYGFTGARNAIAAAMADGYLTQRTFLTQSFRFGPAIAGAANFVLSILGADLRISGYDVIESTIGPTPTPDVVLTRTNAGSLGGLLDALDLGLTVHLTGGSDQLVKFAKAAAQLKDGERTYHPELACFGSWGEVQEYADLDPLGDELALMVKLVDDYGTDRIIDALENMATLYEADVVFSTAHKAKGLEWNQVRLADDFPLFDPAKPFPHEELRLLYVAATRAKLRLDPTAVPLFRSTYR